jgi:hypothetical protein
MVALMVLATALIGQPGIEGQRQAAQPVIPQRLPMPQHPVHGVVSEDEKSCV